MFDLEKIGHGLPVLETVRNLGPVGRLVVEAPPGTGKTTLIPPAVANQVSGKVVVTAPRRVAVKAAANRLQALSGQKVGYAMRGDVRRGGQVEFVTPGVLLNRFLRDPELPGVDAVIIDEVHERQVETDLVLAMAHEISQLRDLKLVAMSATLDARQFADYLDAPILSTPATTHPLTISYTPHPGRAQRSDDFYRHLATLARGHEGSVLVFVPGVREVEMVADMVGGVPLHGRIDAAPAFAGGDKIIVSTSIAESSVTVPGVRTVIDSGLSRVPQRDARGMTGLVTVSAARSTVQQRAGRAGREGPGKVIRAYSETDYRHFPADITPEILTSDPLRVALVWQTWGPLDLLDTPPLEEAQRQLERLDDHEQLARLPLDPRLGHALLTHGAQALPVIAKLVDEPLRIDVPDKGPVDPGVVVATAFPDQIACDGLMASGTRVEKLPAGWCVVADLFRAGAKVIARETYPIAREDALAILGVEETVEAHYDGKIRGRKVRRAGAIELSSTPVSIEPEAAAEALARSMTWQDFEFSKEASALFERLLFAHEHLGAPDPRGVDLSWEFYQIARGEKPNILQTLKAQFHDPLPATLALPSGRKARILYDGPRPVIRVKLQDCFGLDSSPVIAGHKVQFHLLSPAGRPVAITDDLASFWAEPYKDVRKDMRGRYPKHSWPERPQG